jgi:Chitobiase/beta-hexosaminidase C-terminal domain
MKTTIFSFEVLAVIIAVTILQACAATTTTTQCAKPTLTPPGVSAPVHSVTVRIATATTGANLRYTLDGSTPTGGPSGHGTRIAAASGSVRVYFGVKGTTLKAIAYKAGWTTSLIAVGEYAYEHGGGQ